MVDLDTKRIIDCINTRDIGEVCNWLKTYPNLKIVSRDGSIAYRSAIESVNENIIQLSDRFHLIKGLSEAMSQILRNILPVSIIVDEVKVDLKKTIKERYLLVKKDLEAGRSLSISCLDNSIDIRVMKKLMNFNELELENYFTNKYERSNKEKLNKKSEIIQKTKELFNKGLSKAEITRQLALNKKTVAKYIEIEKFTKNIRDDKANACAAYDDIIYQMIKDKATITAIYQKIVAKGYNKKYGNLKAYINSLKKNGNVLFKQTVKRKHIITLLYKPLSESKNVNREILKKVYKKHPESKVIIELMCEFKNVLLKYKNSEKLKKWMNKCLSYNYGALNSFINGLNRDFTAVENSLKYTFSNGIVEASVNKIKLVKRIMYGRSSFEMIIKKTLRLEFMRHFN